MVWTAPMTAVDNAIFTAAQFNTHIRDNLLETMPGKAVTVGSYFVSDGANTISERYSYTANVLTEQSTASTTYTDLTTVGPQISGFIPSPSFFVFIGAEMVNSSASATSIMGFSLTGADTIAANDNIIAAAGGTNRKQLTNIFRVAPASPGTPSTITAKYRTTSGTATFANRWIGILNF